MSILDTIVTINPFAVLVAGIVHMVTGLIWYQPGIFGKPWMELTGKDLKPASQWMILGLIGHFAIALVLAIIVYLANATTAISGILVGVLVWVGFIVTLEIGELIWEKISFKLFLIRISEHLVSLGLAGMILAIWR